MTRSRGPSPFCGRPCRLDQLDDGRIGGEVGCGRALNRDEERLADGIDSTEDRMLDRLGDRLA